MALVRRFEDLEAWQAARRLTAQAFVLTQRSTKLGTDRSLSDQLRRAAVSTMSNIAEGIDSGSRTEFRRFLRYAARSASEVQSCLYVAKDQGYVDHSSFEEAYGEAQRVRQLCSGLIRLMPVRGRRNQAETIAEDCEVYASARCALPTLPQRPHARTGARAHTPSPT
jgi:four helix bundle protein